MRLYLRTAWLAWVASAQDPLAPSDFYPPPAARGMRPVGATAPPQQRPPWLGHLGFLAFGAGAMKVVDLARERKLKRSLDAASSSLESKRRESLQLSSRLRSLEFEVDELRNALYRSEAEALQRDWDEFKAPDLDDDDFISAEEFFSYIDQYMKAYPTIPQGDYPTFGDFDRDRSGDVTFQEWQAYLQQQSKQKDGAGDKEGSSSSSSTAGTTRVGAI
mmetsp:Transcript_20183/g.64998  ORF Transcript_20183/g.64998 Transcript_20183/m.64998 type:complete len:218 (+) Transcript_20183:369-1022(+)